MTTSLVAIPANAQDVDTTPIEDEVVSTGVFIPNEKRITSEITSVLDEEMFETIGAGDIAGALTRVTGISLSQGKFAIVRGLNERYSSSNINGSPLPSPEPLRRVAPLDLFPTSVLSDVVVSKTFRPEMSGEFGGGAIALSTRAVPNEPFFDISISGAANTETTLKDGFITNGSDNDVFGFDDGLRDLPPLDENGEVVPGNNFDNFSTLLIAETDIPGDWGVRVTGGTRKDFDNGSSLGVLATLGYSNDWSTKRGVSNVARIGGDGLELIEGLSEVTTTNDIGLNGLLTLGYEIDENNEITFNALMTRSTTIGSEVNEGFTQEFDSFRRETNEYFEREAYMGQFLGEHYIASLNDAEITWRASYSIAGRDAPYERFIDFENDGDGFFLENDTNSNGLTFTTLDDDTYDAGLDITIPFDIGTRTVDFKFGGAYLDKSRDTEQSLFRYIGGNGGTIDPRLGTLRPDFIFSSSFLVAGLTQIDRLGTVGFPDLSSASLETIAGYVGIDTELTPELRIALGGRFESSTQTTQIGVAFSGDPLVTLPELEDDFFLPAATLTYTFADNFQLRLAASKTINRPQFRELTPTVFINPDTNGQFVGNPFLVNSEATNLDARLEYYFGPNQFFTIGGFYKDLTNPIEEFNFNALPQPNSTGFINAPSAEVYGMEVEFERRWSFSDIADKIGLFSDADLGDKDFILRSNYTLTSSSVSADGEVSFAGISANPGTSLPTPNPIPASGLYTDGRSLQGQSDHLANLQIGIKDYDKNMEATLLLNYQSERIRSVESAADGLPSIIEQLPLSLDFVFNYDFDLRGGDYSLGLKVQNILGDDYEARQELDGSEVVIDGYDIGTTFAASLKRRF